MDKENSNHGHPEPPGHSRFPKGTSGNPKGRPKGARNMKNIVKNVASRKIARPDGSTTTLIELLLKKLREAALQGKVTEANYFHSLTAKI